MSRLVALIIALLLLCAPVAAAGRVRLVVIDGVHFEHLQAPELVNFQRLLQEGGVALVNSNTAGGRNAEHAAVTLGAGTRALGQGAGLAFPGDAWVEDSMAWQVLARRTGVEASPDNLVLLEIAAITQNNGELTYPVQPGLLAQQLREAGFGVAVLANSDGQDVFRPAVAIGADINGVVQQGRCGPELYRDDPQAPYGRRADLEVYLHWLEQWREVDFVVIDSGDTTRLQQYAGHVTETQKETLRLNALLTVDQLLGWLLADLGPGDLLLVAGLQADHNLGIEEGRWLTPLLAWGGDLSPGLLGSGTTRRGGVVANLDITATILDHFGLEGIGFGQPLAVYARGNVDYLQSREVQMGRVYLQRTPYIRTYIGVVILLVIMALAALLMGWRYQKWLKLGLAAALASPLALLLLSIFSGHILTPVFWLLLVIPAALALGRLWPRRAMILVGGVTASFVATDALLGTWLQQRSVLGYDAIVGARYYGIGNEYMGVLVGSTLLAAGALKQRWQRGLVYALVLILLALPGVGANFGGTLAAGAGFTCALLEARDLATKRNRLLAVLIVLGLALGFALVNLLGERSHVGRFMVLVAQDPSQFWLTMERKLTMAWRLVRWSLWSRAFAVLMLAAVWALVRGRGYWARQLGGDWPLVRGALAAALAALLLNDSGIVAAATTLFFLTFPLLYVQLSSRSAVSSSHSR